MRVADFFSGIGGFALGLERAGHRTVSFSEIDPYCCRVLQKHWPEVPNLGDIRELDPAAIPDAELWCGGFPCQPFSVAGKRKATDDERDLWPHWHRLIAACRPRWILGENVPGLLSAEGGAAWGRIVRDMDALGYVGEWTVLGARNVGAPHRRDRLWIVATLADAYEPGPQGRGLLPQRGGERPAGQGGVADTIRLREPQGSEPNERGRPGDGGGEWWATDPADLEDAERTRWLARWAKQPGDAQGAGARRWAGRPGGWRPQPELGRVAHGVPHRVDRLRALGNAVVPQVVEAIARRL